MDLRSKAIAPFEELSSEFEDAIVFVDGGAAEAVRWCGGVEFMFERMRIANLHDFRTPVSAHLCRSLVQVTAHKAIFLLNTLLWDCEADLLSAIRAADFDEVLVCCSISEAAHALYSTKVDSNQEGGALRFNTFAAKLVSQLSSSEGEVKLNVRFFPMIYSTILSSAPGNMAAADKSNPLGFFVLNNVDCAECCPLSLCQVESGDELSGAQTPGSSPRPKYEHVSEVGAGDVPPALRLRYKLLANVLAELLAQWGLTVDGSTFALGGSSKLLGYSMLQMLQQRQEALIIEREMDADQVLELLHSRQPASLVLIDRSVDLFTPATHSDSLADRILDALPRVNRSQQHPSSPPPTSCHEVASGYNGSGGDTFSGEALGFGGPPILQQASDSPTSSFSWSGGMGVAHVSSADPESSSEGESAGADGCAWGELLSRSTDRQALRALHTALAKMLKGEQCPKLPGWGKRGRDAVFQLLRSMGAYRLGECSRHHEILQVALAAVESLHATEPNPAVGQGGEVSGELSAWRQLMEAERHQLATVLEFVGGSKEGAGDAKACAGQLVDQVCTLLEAQSRIPLRDLLVLSLRACSLAGPIFGERGMIDGTPRAMRPLQRALRAALLNPSSRAELQGLMMMTEGEVDNIMAAARCRNKEAQEQREGGAGEGAGGDDGASNAMANDAVDRVVRRVMEQCWEASTMRNGLLPSFDSRADSGTSNSEEGKLCGVKMAADDGGILASLCRGIMNPDAQTVQTEMVSSLEQLSELSASPSAALGNAITSWFGGGQATKKPRPSDRPLVVVFVLGGVTYAEARSIEQAIQASSNDKRQLILGSTTVATRTHIYNQGFHPAE
jgi:hypothetical protein